jgi:DNA-binding MarR family transcriptional regulator
MTANLELIETAKCLCLASRRAARAITRAFDKELRARGIRATQFSLLAILALKGPRSIGELATMLGADRTTLTRNLALVEHAALVRIRAGDDARARVVTITPKGRRTVYAALPGWRKVQSALSDSIGLGTADSLRQLSRELRL